MPQNANHAPDEILVAGLELRACIGVTETERREPQRLTVSLALQPTNGFSALEDDLGRTVNYSAVCRRMRALAGARAWVLLETFAEEIAGVLLTEFACAQAQVELRKYVLPDTEYVAVRIVRRRG